MTNDEINARIAELFGDQIALDADGWHIVGDAGRLWPIPDYYNSMVAWVTLFNWLCAHEWEVSLIARGEGTVEARVRHHYTRGFFGMAEDPAPSRALVIATLKAHGVTV